MFRKERAHINRLITELLNQLTVRRDDCNFCKESYLEIGQGGNYGSPVIYKIGESIADGWFATLSRSTGGDPEKDFCVQLMPLGILFKLLRFLNLNS